MVQSVKSESDNDLFSVSLIAFGVKGSITLDDAFLHVNMPNTILFGLLPAGKNKDSSPLSGITNVYTSKSYKLGSIFLGAIVILLGLALMGSSFFSALIAILIGAAILGSGIKTSFTYERSGITKVIEFPFFEAQRVDELEDKLTSKLAQYQDDRNFRKQSEMTRAQSVNNTTSVVNAIKDNTNSNDAAASDFVFCSHCGAKLSAGTEFCNKCGTKLAN
ncbi:zinc ribbon domain-containing protein [Companilactobacillus musae]|uniref:zinc ribbon domain-containing protein n=1 Tax=Companilactobacillus musae TaxID=1903258 RepID=UPI000E65AAAF|nr:zinc ribbon domain-containing protein [Companilactobacillus musae]